MKHEPTKSNITMETIKIDQLLVESETMALLIISEIIKAFDGVGTGASISTGKEA